MSPSDVGIHVRGLHKSYGKTVALRGIDLDVEAGQVFGFLGPNGAGKTTTIRCLLDLIRPNSGELSVLGMNPQEDPEGVRRQVGYLPGELNIDGGTTARSTLSFLRKLRGDGPEQPWLDIAHRLDLDLDQKVKNLSKGNKQKVGIVQAFAPHPPLLLLDEPTSGLDPLVQQEVYALIKEAHERGTTVFMSSHVLSEVQAVTTRVGIIKNGLVVELADTDALIHRSFLQARIQFGTQAPSLDGVQGISHLQAIDSNTVSVHVEGAMDPLIKFLANHTVISLETEYPSLEDIFLRYYEDE